MLDLMIKMLAEIILLIAIRLISTTCDNCPQFAKKTVSKWKYESKPLSGLQSETVVREFKQL